MDESERDTVAGAAGRGTGGQSFPAVEQWASHGRHPSLEMRHTVDDVLLAATSKSFLLFRAMCHRNRDSIIVFSESAREVKPRAAGSGPAPQRGVVLTNRHLYVITMPTTALFAPSAGGGCFSWQDFGRMCFTKTSPHAVFQFVGGVVALQFSTQKEVERLGRVVYSTTGIPPQEITRDDLDVAKRGAREFSQTFRSFDLESSSAGATNLHATIGSSGDGGKTRPRCSPSVVPPTAGARGTTESSPSAGRVGTDVPNVDNMLRFILGGGEGGSGGGYETLYPSTASQTELVVAAAAVQCHPTTTDRGTSPIRFLPEGFRGGAGGGGGGGGGGGVGFYQPNSGGDGDGGRSESASTVSEFDHNDVWRSLHGTPFKAATTPHGTGSGKQMHHRSARREPSPASRQRPRGASAALAGGGGVGVAPAAERRIHFGGGGDAGGGGGGGGGGDAGGGGSGPHLRSLSDDGSASGESGPSNRSRAATLLSSTPPPAPSLTPPALPVAEEGLFRSDHALAARQPMASEHHNNDCAAPQPEPFKRHQSVRAAANFDSFLGVLATYRPALADGGVDSTSKLLRLSESELQELMDVAGIAKMGHRTLLLSKVNLAKQARTAKKVVGS